jgi:hypothetical protein
MTRKISLCLKDFDDIHFPQNLQSPSNLPKSRTRSGNPLGGGDFIKIPGDRSLGFETFKHNAMFRTWLKFF